LIAGLPASSARVIEKPPLSWRLPRFAPTFVWSPVAASGQVASLLRLCPSELILPVERLQLVAVLPAIMVFLRIGSLPAVVRRSPPPVFAELLLIVTLVRVSAIPGAIVEVVRIPPPAPLADVTLLLEIVTFVSTALWALFRPPPLNPFEKFPWITLSLIVR
jgi:hypothetical protein